MVIPVIIWVWTAMDTLAALLFTAYMIPVNLIDNVLRPLLMGRGLETPIVVILIGLIGGTISLGHHRAVPWADHPGGDLGTGRGLDQGERKCMRPRSAAACSRTTSGGRIPHPSDPSAPTLLTADASPGVVTPLIGACMSGCSMPRSSGNFAAT